MSADGMISSQKRHVSLQQRRVFLRYVALLPLFAVDCILSPPSSISHHAPITNNKLENNPLENSPLVMELASADFYAKHNLAG